MKAKVYIKLTNGETIEVETLDFFVDEFIVNLGFHGGIPKTRIAEMTVKFVVSGTKE